MMVFSCICIQIYEQLANYLFVLQNYIKGLTVTRQTCKKETFAAPLCYERGVQKKRKTAA